MGCGKVYRQIVRCHKTYLTNNIGDKLEGRWRILQDCCEAGAQSGWQWVRYTAHPVTKLTTPLPLLEALRVVHWWELFTASGERWLHLSVLLDQVNTFDKILSLYFKCFE